MILLKNISLHTIHEAIENDVNNLRLSAMSSDSHSNLRFSNGIKLNNTYNNNNQVNENETNSNRVSLIDNKDIKVNKDSKSTEIIFGEKDTIEDVNFEENPEMVLKSLNMLQQKYQDKFEPADSELFSKLIQFIEKNYDDS